MSKDISLCHKATGRSSPFHFEVALSADVNAISPIVEAVLRLVEQLAYAAGKEFEIEMALREALANAVIHGCKGDPKKKIECSVTGDQDRGILIVVSDPGDGFDPAHLPSPTDGQNLFSDHGRGIFLISRLMDEVQYERNGAKIRMRKY
jgi:serine/threonine-protein kinase RsbW